MWSGAAYGGYQGYGYEAGWGERRQAQFSVVIDLTVVAQGEGKVGQLAACSETSDNEEATVAIEHISKACSCGMATKRRGDSMLMGNLLILLEYLDVNMLAGSVVMALLINLTWCENGRDGCEGIHQNTAL